jgi:hypothetical protein
MRTLTCIALLALRCQIDLGGNARRFGLPRLRHIATSRPPNVPADVLAGTWNQTGALGTTDNQKR